MSGKAGARYAPVYCGEHDQVHGLTTGALILVAEAGQAGNTVTTLGNPVCFLPILDEWNDKHGFWLNKEHTRRVGYCFDVEDQQRTPAKAGS